MTSNQGKVLEIVNLGLTSDPKAASGEDGRSKAGDREFGPSSQPIEVPKIPPSSTCNTMRLAGIECSVIL